MRRVLFLVLVLCLGISVPLAAHSFLVKAQPAPGSTVTKPPARLVIRFREPAVTRFSRITVLDSRGNKVSESPQFSKDQYQAVVPLHRLSPGKYTVKWRVLSATDGHTTASTYTFTVMAPKRGLRLMPAHMLTAPLAHIPWLTVEESMHVDWAWTHLTLKWVILVASIALVGTALFTVFVLDPFDAGPKPEGITDTQRTFSTVRSMSVVAGIVLLASLVCGTVFQAATLLEAGFLKTLLSNDLVAFLTQTKPGWSAIVQGTLALILLFPHSATGRILQMASLGLLALGGAVAGVLGGTLQALPDTHLIVGTFWSVAYGVTVVTLAVALPRIPGIQLPSLSWVPALVGLMLLTGGVLTSHSMPLGTLAAAIHWMHLAAISMWIGGLGALVVVLMAERGPQRAILASALVPRFSRFAGIGLGLTAITGGGLAILQVSDLSAVVSSLYGRILLLKLTFIAPLVTLGGLIRVFLIPRIRNGQQYHAAGTAFRFATGEVGLVIVVIAISAVLANTPPARQMVNTPPPSVSTHMPASVPTTAQAGSSMANHRSLVRTPQYHPGFGIVGRP